MCCETYKGKSQVTSLSFRRLLVHDLDPQLPYGTMVVDATPLLEFLPELTKRSFKQVAPLGPSADRMWVETMCGTAPVGTELQWSDSKSVSVGGETLTFRWLHGRSVVDFGTSRDVLKWSVGVHENGMVLLFEVGSWTNLWGRWLIVAPETPHVVAEAKGYIRYELVYPILWTLGFINGTDGSGKHAPRMKPMNPPRGTPNRATTRRYNVIYLPYRRSQCSEVSNGTGNPRSAVWFRRGHWYKRAGVKRWRRWHWCVGSAAQNAFVDKHYVARA